MEKAREFKKNIYFSFTEYAKAEVDVFLGEGNGTPLQYFCLENPMDGGVW